ncbi:MAG: discoidin domain-containing protein [Chloroflexota bacterium]
MNLKQWVHQYKHYHILIWGLCLFLGLVVMLMPDTMVAALVASEQAAKAQEQRVLPISVPEDMQNVALNKTVTVSGGSNPQMAVDGDPEKGWNARWYAPAWIEIDLAEPYPVHLLRLRVSQSPSGNTTHHVYVSGPDKNLVLLHTFQGFTSSGDWLVHEPATPVEGIQHVRIHTPSSPSWIAWFEIEVYSPEELLAGDINDDGEVNIFDLQILIGMILHTTQPDAELYELDWWDRGELNEDGVWNIFDLQIMINLIISS